ncbi:hypothetical protein M8J77_013668 [Diaphorina citri]|nr:hypothetical protein M8J77_013668 [Diaphorina citri]
METDRKYLKASGTDEEDDIFFDVHSHDGTAEVDHNHTGPTGSPKHETSISIDLGSGKTEEEEPLDFILVWAKPYNRREELEQEANHAEMKRNIFEKNLKKQGLILKEHHNGHLCFVTIYAPRSVLLTYADIMKLRMPMKSYDDTDGSTKKFNILSEAANFVVLFIKLCIAIEPANMPMKKLPLTAQYTKAKHYLFDEENSDFLSPPSRSLIIDFILSRQSFTANNKDLSNVGIQRLIEDGIYKAAYPLHDGDWATGDPEKSLRYSLYKEWAHLRNWIKNQPADQIKEYLGVKCAFYFVWLGFYTHMLIPASILGLTVFLYGVFTLNNDSLSRDICNKTLNIIMCPLCDRTCDYWKLSDTCKSARVTYLFDNTFSVIFAFLMSIWAVLFLESWKRYSAAITHRWGLTHFTLEAEHPRPSYLARLSHLKRTKTIMNIITGTEEPRAPFWIRWPTRILSFSVVLILIMCALATVVGVVLYRMSLYATLSLSHKADWMNSYGIVIIPFTAACINLVCIQILNLVYARLATYMTEFEYLRTQTEFDESLAIKIYLFQFVNYYTSIFYIAFLKGKFIGYPAKYTRVFNLRQEECSPGGCFMELSIQLAVIMVGQQTFNSIVEMFIPYFWKLYNVFMITTGLSDDLSETQKNADLINLRDNGETELETNQRNDNATKKSDKLINDTNRLLNKETAIELKPMNKSEGNSSPEHGEKNRNLAMISSLKDKAQNSMKKTLKKTASVISDELIRNSSLTSKSTTTTDPRAKQWLEDFKLLDWGTRGLYPEYLEMVLQYGFVVLFVSAFPLAPLFALINNIFETRLDAQKFLKYYRRPVPHRATNIGIWFRVLDVVAKLAVISNAVLIAFTSNFIPRIMYKFLGSKNFTDEGFLNDTLSYFNTSDFQESARPLYPSINVTMCRYHNYRNPPWFEPNHLKYKRSWYYWKLLAARLGFIVVFQNVVSFGMIILQWLIPDIPSELKDQIKREEYLTSELIIKHETKRATAKQSKHDYRRTKSTANLIDSPSSLTSQHEEIETASDEKTS